MPHHHSTQAISDAALQWLIRLHSGEMTAAERRAFEAWLAAAPEHRRAFAEAEALWQDTGHLVHDPRTGLVRPASEPPGTAHTARPWGTRWRYGAAAALAFCLVLTWHGWLSAWLLSDYLTGTETRRLVLADGSHVHLNAHTRVSVELAGVRRHVTLQAGGAWFTVAPDTRGRPFEVEAGDLLVTALGTEFLVERATRGGWVAVTEHAVEVAAAQTPAAQRQRVSAGQGLDARDRSPDHWEFRPIDAATEGAWRTGRLIFESRPLGEVAAALGTYRRGWVVIADPTLRQHPISGVFEITQPDRALDSLTHAAPIRIVRFSPLLTLIVAAD